VLWGHIYGEAFPEGQRDARSVGGGGGERRIILLARVSPGKRWISSRGLTGLGRRGCMVPMRISCTVGLLSAALLAGGCVGTLDGRRTAGVPFVKDRVEGRYERPVERVYAAAREVIRFNGTLVRESTQHGETNTVRVLEGKINQRSVWVRVEPVDPKVTSVVVQARTPAGGKDIDLAHEIEKQIALQLTR